MIVPFALCLDKRSTNIHCKIHCNPNKIAQAKRLSIEGPDTSVCRSVPRFTEKSFHFNGDCFLCGTLADGGEQRKKVDAFKVTTIEMKDTILAICSKRRNAWSDTVQARIMYIHHLPAADAMYPRHVASISAQESKFQRCL